MPLFMYMCMCWSVNVASLLVYVLEGSIVDLSMSMSMGEAMLPMLMSMCKELGWVIVASVHVHVYVLRVNVASVHVQVDGLGRGVNVASVHFHVYASGKGVNVASVHLHVHVFSSLVNFKKEKFIVNGKCIDP